MEMIGQIKYIDKLGRIVIPKEMRKFYKIENESPVEIFLTSEGILLRPLSFEVVREKENP